MKKSAEGEKKRGYREWLRWLRRLKAGVGQLLKAERKSLSKSAALLVYLVLLIRETVRELIRGKSMLRATALAYKTVVSIVPVVAIALALFAGLPSLRDKKDAFLDFVVEVLVPLPYGGEAEEAGEPAETGEAEKPRALTPDDTDSETKAKIRALLASRADLREMFRDALEVLAENAAAVEGIGVVVLLLVLISLLNTIELSFNELWHVEVRRGILRRVLYFTAVSVWGFVLLSASLYVSAWVHKRIPHDAGLLSRAFYGLTPFVLTSAIFSTAYMMLPHVKVRLSAAIASGIVAGTAWDITKLLLRLYFTKVVGYSKIYGSLGAFPIFLVWIYVSWLIVFFGANLGFCIQNFDDLTAKEAVQKRASGARTYFAVRIALEAARRFAIGQAPQEIGDMASVLGIPEYALREVAGQLVEGGILVAVEGDTERYLPARPLSDMTVRDVAQAAHGIRLEVPEMVDPDGKTVAELFGQAEAASADALSMNFEQLVQKVEEGRE